jgi:hypothetical protein
MQKELSMTRIQDGLLLGCVLLAIALLAVFDVIPQAVAQYAPLAVVPFVIRNGQCCRGRLSERRS